MDNFYEEDEILEYDEDDVEVVDAPRTSLIKIVSKSISFTFDTSKIVEAVSKAISESVTEALRNLQESITRLVDMIDFSGIQKAASRMIDLFAGVGGFMRERATTLFAGMGTFCHWLIASLHGWFGTRKKTRPAELPYHIKQAALLYPVPCVKTLQVKFQEFSPRIRSAFLLHCRERGTSSDDEDDFTLYAVA